ncbi:hypothetical protein B0H13DRAFT_2021462 [Mycena leptocephala]|nr:hypothetical protein B0H13DRAFT_2021462 [Mycena leptocephala]
MLSTLTFSIVGCALAPAVCGIVGTRITCSLGAATNLILTGFTAGRILWIQQAASHIGLDNTLRSRYNTAVGIILESGAIYCVAAIFLVITVSLDGGFFYLGFVSSILICGYVLPVLRNIIPMFSLVYVGMKYPVDSAAGHSSRAPFRQHLPVRLTTMQPGQVLHIKPQGTEQKNDECV